MKKKLIKNLNKYIILMFILLITSKIMLRQKKETLNIIGVVLIPIILIIGILMLRKNKK